MSSRLSNARLVRRAYVTPQAMNQVLATLIGGGLITRRPGDDGRRMLAGVRQADHRSLPDTIRACVQRINAGLPGT